MSAEPGTYTIQNVRHRSFATQSPESTVVADADTDAGPSYGPNLRKMSWTISRLNNDKYTIKNIETEGYAASTTRPVFGDGISQNLYNCANTELFLGLTDGELLTAISLENTPNNRSNQWILTRVSPCQEENAKLRDSIERLKETAAKASGDAQREIERHEHEDGQLQAKLARLEEEEAKLRGSVAQLKEDARREKERHEAEIKTPNSVPKPEKRSCVIM
ncbi:hypothetical protein BD410DRAFT_810276 [Rickenella mellea]|uniref:Uncharacterized protein n=1 Tax=Rickenella mellea TaxID=50990 RepID=A0A4Y7PEE4_9AGAM|nr:hypothetical protein BD410DRAFT_810276 [Rickenella mellea]